MLACQKNLFSLPENLHYLNCAFMAPLPRRVEAAGIEGIRQKAVPSRITPEDFFEPSDGVRRRFARLVNVDDPRRVAIIPAASYGLATVAKNTPLSAGQNVVVLHEQFPSNVYAWRRLAAERNVELRTIHPPKGAVHRGMVWNERILDAIDVKTALVALPHVHWADGTRFDLERIGERARDVGAALVIDGTQSVGALPFDAARLRPDALICAGYKWLLGPYSIGVAYFGPRYDDGVPLEENWIARRGSEHFAGLVAYEDAYQPGAIRFDVGERSNFILVPMLAAALDHLLEWGVAHVQAYCRALTRDVLIEARALGFDLEDEGYRSAHLFGIRVPAHVPMERLREALAERNVSASVRGNALRLAPNVYNDEADVDALRDAFLACLRPARHHSLPGT
ncbi:aminotransferase class V-fold PLP-dependent enzyme [Rhodocaloribacter sp.]